MQKTVINSSNSAYHLTTAACTINDVQKKTSLTVKDILTNENTTTMLFLIKIKTIVNAFSN